MRPCPLTTPMMERRLFVTFVTISPLALTGCGDLPPLGLAVPTVSLADLSVESMGRDSAQFKAVLATRNPNPIDLPISRLGLHFSVLGQPLAVGRLSEDRVVLPAGGEREVPLRFAVSNADLRAVVGRLISTRPLPETVWELKGTAYWGDSALPLSFTKRGDATALRRLREPFSPIRP